ncbi:hypothetical protein XFF6990_320031 [Xanthomonas citri pv. fuscans]|nr:hypothetical protein XFF6990_320031 [Xanthomonas citri pv. fuscans]
MGVRKEGMSGIRNCPHASLFDNADPERTMDKIGNPLVRIPNPECLIPALQRVSAPDAH